MGKLSRSFLGSIVVLVGWVQLGNAQPRGEVDMRAAMCTAVCPSQTGCALCGASCQGSGDRSITTCTYDCSGFCRSV